MAVRNKAGHGRRKPAGSAYDIIIRILVIRQNINSKELPFCNYNANQTFVQTTETDSNGDGRYDRLNLQLAMPLFDTEQVTSVTMMIIFDYVLQVLHWFPNYI